MQQKWPSNTVNKSSHENYHLILSKNITEHHHVSREWSWHVLESVQIYYYTVKTYTEAI